MKSKLIEQIEVLEKAQKEALISCRYETIVMLSQMILHCSKELETLK